MKHMKNHRAVFLESTGCRAAVVTDLRRGIAGGRHPPQDMHTNAHKRETMHTEGKQ